MSGPTGHRTPSCWGATGSCHVRYPHSEEGAGTMDAMSTRPRPAAVPSIALASALVLAACGGSSPASTAPAASSAASASASPAASPAEPSLTPVPGGSAAPPPSGASGLPAQTDTEWGRIWDALPAWFPAFPGSIPTEALNGPASGASSVPAGPEEAAVFMQAALETAGYSTEALSGPFEDGSYVLDSIGDAVECRIETRLTPLSGTTHMTVMYGAGCPIE